MSRFSRGRIVLINVAFLVMAGGVLLAYMRVFAPVLSIEENPCNFGIVTPGKRLERDIRVSNSGGRTLTIQSISSSCGCTGARIDKNVLAAKESTLIHVRLHAALESGKMSEMILLKWNNPIKRNLPLPIVALVDPILEISPARVDFGVLESNLLPVERLVTIRPSLARPLAPEIELTTDSDYLSGHLGKQEVPDRYELRLKLSSKTPIGPIQGNIFLKASSVSNHIFQIAVGGKVIGDLRAEPETLYFGTIPQGCEQSLSGKIIAVHPVGKYGINILPASASRFMAGRMTDRTSFEVVILSNAPPGRVSATARIASPKDKNAVVEAPIFAYISTNVNTLAQGAGPAANH